MDQYLFFFGRTPDLSFSELQSFIPEVRLFSETIGIVDTPFVLIDGIKRPTENLMSYLGGTIKIAKVLTSVDTVTDRSIAKLLSEESGRECVFALSSQTPQFHVDQRLLTRVKDLLSPDFGKVRYLTARHESGVSNVAIKNEHARELTIFGNDEKFLIAKTLTVQNVDTWAEREYGRPYADAKAGMLPTKVARMVVNIALGGDGKGKKVLDPFCGMGTIVTEVLQRDASGFGGDIDEEVVRKANGNMRWSTKAFGYDPKSFSIQKADAVHSSELYPNTLFDAIVTEPFLGSAKLGEGKITEGKEIKNIVKGLTKLYIGCLKDWKKILKDEGRIVMAFPSIMKGKTEYSPVKSIIDTCEILGYTRLLGPLSYHRPDAIVRREFFVFEKK